MDKTPCLFLCHILIYRLMFITETIKKVWPLLLSNHYFTGFFGHAFLATTNVFVQLTALVVSSEAWSRPAPPWSNSKYNTPIRIDHDADSMIDNREDSFPPDTVLTAPSPTSSARRTYFKPNPSYSLSYVTGNNVDVEEKLPEYQLFESKAHSSPEVIKMQSEQSMDPSYSFRYSMQDKVCDLSLYFLLCPNIIFE